MSKHKHLCENIKSSTYENGITTPNQCGNGASNFHEDTKRWFCDKCWTYTYNPDGSLKAKTEDSYGGSDEYSESGTDDPVDLGHTMGD
jgi:hypothetical protein